MAECDQTTYLVPETRLKRSRKGPEPRASALSDFALPDGTLHLTRGGTIRLTRGMIAPTDLKRKGRRSPQIPSVACTLPEIFDQVEVGERIWFDDGRIGGVIRGITPEWLDIEITHARDSGEKLAGDKGINLPDSQLNLPALTEKDIADLVRRRQGSRSGRTVVCPARERRGTPCGTASMNSASRTSVLFSR